MSDKKPVRLGLIGCGHIAQAHLNSLLQVHHAGLVPVELIACCDREIERAELFRRNYGFQCSCTDFRPVLEDASLDAVYVCSPTRDHMEPVLLAAELKRPLFCEKPLGRDLAEVERMVKAVEASRIPAQLGLVLRFSPVYQVMRSLLEEPGGGRPMAAVFRDDQYFPIGGSYGSSWRGNREVVGSGTLLEHSIHDVDLLRWFFGEVTRVRARVDYFSGREGVEDQAVLLLEFANGARATLTSLWHQMLGRESNRNLEIFLERRYVGSAHDFMGSIDTQGATGEGRVLNRRQVDVLHRRILGKQAPPGKLAHNPYLLENLAFLRALQAGKKPFPDFASGLAAHRVVEAAYRSAREDAPVPVSG
ncbi:MAG: Gfo/Idh/MocA family oxidoreductase [Candidatus Eremiobacterota bacterium]